MPIILNFKNVGEIVFSNKKAIAALKNYKDYIDNWYFATRAGSMRHMIKSAEMNFLRNIKEEDIKILENILGDKVYVDSDVMKTIINLKSDIRNLEFNLPCDFNFIDLSVYRHKETVEVTIWR